MLCFLILAFLIVLFSTFVGLFFVDRNFFGLFEQLSVLPLLLLFLFINQLISILHEIIEVSFFLVLFNRSMSQLIVLILRGMKIYHFEQHLSDYLVIVLLVQILLVIFKLQHLALVVLHFV